MAPEDFICPTCGAEPGAKCTTVLKPGGEWVAVLNYFHSARYAELTRAGIDAAKLAEHQRIYGGTKP